MKHYAKLTILLLAAVPVLIACTGAPKFSNIQNKDWYLTEVRTKPEIDFDRKQLAEENFGEIFTLRFESERISGVAAPNRYFAPYEQQGKDRALTIKTIAGTFMAPLREPEKLKERDYFAYLQNTTKWNLVNGKLELHTKSEDSTNVTLIFTPAAK
ncbi:MAG: META domain-containing protein [Treponema sp.]|nr:META domain-containing protein [Treponema sp.]